LCGFTDRRDLQRAHRQWVEQALDDGLASRDDRWSGSIAVGTFDFVERIKNDLGIKAMHREVLEADGMYALREPSEAYTRNLTGENKALSSENTLPWNESLETQVDSVVRPRNTTCNHLKTHSRPYNDRPKTSPGENRSEFFNRVAEVQMIRAGLCEFITSESKEIG